MRSPRHPSHHHLIPHLSLPALPPPIVLLPFPLSNPDARKKLIPHSTTSRFARLWTPFPGYGNETCRFCGTAVLSTGCWVNANYCDTDKANCKNENTEAALALDPGDGRALGVGDSGPWNGSRSELTVHGWNTCKARFA